MFAHYQWNVRACQVPLRRTIHRNPSFLGGMLLGHRQHKRRPLRGTRIDQCARQPALGDGNGRRMPPCLPAAPDLLPEDNDPAGEHPDGGPEPDPIQYHLHPSPVFHGTPALLPARGALMGMTRLLARSFTSVSGAERAPEPKGPAPTRPWTRSVAPRTPLSRYGPE